MHDPDQFSTDLGKCVQAVADLEKSSGKSYQLVIVGGLTGRLDQTIHTIHALTELLDTRGNTTWVVDAASIACVLGPVRPFSLCDRPGRVGDWRVGGEWVASVWRVGGSRGGRGEESGQC